MAASAAGMTRAVRIMDQGDGRDVVLPASRVVAIADHGDGLTLIQVDDGTADGSHMVARVDVAELARALGWDVETVGPPVVRL